ncbi:nmrA-like family domain-containing protein 1 [Watersipora subatra]|uniref:nmrA-like family domain-containing protein 1 n=1 Tax=Watersipora subatra TaxID=2589382 RepID=UPI00355B02DE
MQRELVLFLSPELVNTLKDAVERSDSWHSTIYSTGPQRQQSLRDVEGLTSLLRNADTCFIATHTDFTQDACIEVEEGMALGSACKKAGVKNIVLSSHISCEKTIGIPAKHYDAKAEIYTYMRHKLELPVTMVNIPPTFDLFFNFLCPSTTTNGSYQVVFPCVGPAPIDFIASEDIGKCLLPVFEHPEVFRCKTVALCGDKLTGKMVVSILNQELAPMYFRERQVTTQDVRDRSAVGAIDMANMFEFLGRTDLKSSLSGTKELYPLVKSFKSWLADNKVLLVEATLSNLSDNIST